MSTEKKRITIDAVIAEKTDGDPKISLGQLGGSTDVTFSVYNISLDDLMYLTKKFLKLTIEVSEETFGVPYDEDDE